MIISLIAAVDSNMGIGLNGIMPWGYIKEDMAFFKKTTLNYPVVMGRVTFESLNSKPLPNRKNIIISNTITTTEDVCTEKSLEDVIKELLIKKEKQVFIIGGESIYNKAIYYADIVYLTHIDKDYNCDRFFPSFDMNDFNIEVISNFKHQNIDVYIKKYTKNL